MLMQMQTLASRRRSAVRRHTRPRSRLWRNPTSQRNTIRSLSPSMARYVLLRRAIRALYVSISILRFDSSFLHNVFRSLLAPCVRLCAERPDDMFMPCHRIYRTSHAAPVGQSASPNCTGRTVLLFYIPNSPRSHQGMAFLTQYRSLRGVDASTKREVEFNFGRAFHQLGKHSQRYTRALRGC